MFFSPSVLLAATGAFLALDAASSAQTPGKWHYLSTPLPTELSDMSVNVLNLSDGKPHAVLAGGCNSKLGNEFHEMNFGNETHKDILEAFDCFSLSKKVYAFRPSCGGGHEHMADQAHDHEEEGEAGWDGSFEEMADMPRERARHAGVVAADGKLFVIGGRDVNMMLIAEIDMYDPITKEWSVAGTLPETHRRSDIAAFTVANNFIHVVGGFDAEYSAQKTSVLITVDANTGSVLSVADGSTLVEERGDVDAAMSADGTHFYVSGGFHHSNDFCLPRDSVEVFDVSTNVWSKIDNLDEERGDKQLVSINNKLFAIGGETKVDVCGKDKVDLPHLGDRSTIVKTVEVYDIAEGSGWKSAADLPSPIFRFGATEWDENAIFVFGGQGSYDGDCDCFRTTDKVLVYSDGPNFCVKDDTVEEEPESAGPSAWSNVGSVTMAVVAAVAATVSFV